MAKVTVACAVCQRPYPQPVRKIVAKRHQYYVCPQCDTKDVPHKGYEVVRVALSALGGWKGVDVEIPSIDELEALERAEAIRDAALRQLGQENEAKDHEN